MSRPPLLTVVLATRDRGDIAAGAVRTILDSDYPRFELRVVDQSDDDRTEAALQPFLGDARLQYERTTTRGVGAAQNLAIRGARSELIAITDDDCEVGPDWLRRFAAAFAEDHRIGMVFGNVLSGAHDRAAGFVPAYVRKAPFLARGVHQKHQAEGIGACMGVRRSVWEALHGFDEMLGPGAPFRAAGEGDMAIRALLAGYWVYETPEVAVIHHGFRTWEQGRALMHSYWYGTGAMLVKPLKCGHGSVVPLLLRIAMRWAGGRSPVLAASGVPSHRVRRLRSFVQGFLAGAAAPVDRRTQHYLPCRAVPAAAAHFEPAYRG